MSQNQTTRTYLAEIENSLARFGEALLEARLALFKPSAAGAQVSAAGFVNRSADAAEHLAKAMLLRNGRQPRAIHDLGRLADGIAALAERRIAAPDGCN